MAGTSVKINGRNVAIITGIALFGLLVLKLGAEKLPLPDPVKNIIRSA